MGSKPKKYSSRQLTEHLRQLAAEAWDWSEEDGVITRGEALARLLWQKALGWTEESVDEEGEVHKTTHKPESWAIQFLYERMEGKTPQAASEDDGRSVRAKDTVRELAQSRLNSLATKAVNSDSESGSDTNADNGE
jgi:hypothetical protein